jgi:hypothetical protein
LARYVTIINNTTNLLALSDLAVNTKNVPITWQALQTGKYYTVTLTFPPGFEVPPDQPLVFTARTSNPQFAVVKVPISQIPPPKQTAGLTTTPPGAAGLRRPPQPPASSEAFAKPGARPDPGTTPTTSSH